MKKKSFRRRIGCRIQVTIRDEVITFAGSTPPRGRVYDVHGNTKGTAFELLKYVFAQWLKRVTSPGTMSFGGPMHTLFACEMVRPWLATGALATLLRMPWSGGGHHFVGLQVSSCSSNSSI